VKRFGWTVASGSLLSLTIELLQVYESQRVSSLNDFLLNAAGTQVEAASTDSQNGNGDPIEAIDASQFSLQGKRLAIGKVSGEARFLHLSTHGGILAVSTAGQAFGHPVADDAFAVAAVGAAALAHPFTGGAANPVEDFSADGPRRVFSEANGTPITPGNLLSSGGRVRQKPDVTAADGVQVSTPGFTPFFGTSAAAPHAAAIAALVKSANPGLTPAEIRAALTSTALDIETPGFDRDSGAGILDAFAAVQAGGVVSTPIPTPTPTVAPSATPAPIVCAGDCDSSGEVTVDEIVVLVNITLGSASDTACPHGVPNGAALDITLIVQAVNHALTRCPPA